MSRAASAEGPLGAPNLPDGPRFALRFEDGSGRLVLAKPLRFELGIVDALDLDLGPLRFPLDLSAGPSRFRTRRTRVRSASVRIDVPALLARYVEEPFGLAPLAPLDAGMAFALRDAFGTVALDAHARFEGSTLRVVPARARGVHEGPAPALVRAIVAARALGFDLEEDRGALRVERALSAVLLEALVPHGWRVPDDRSVRLAVEVLGARRVALRTLDEGEPEPAPGPEWEQARALSPVLQHLALGEVEQARARWAALRERDASVDGGELGWAEPSGVGPVARSVALRDALRDQDVDEAARLADALERVEPCDAVAVEGLVAAADLAMSVRPTLAGRLLERACARRPSDARIALRLVEAATRLGDAREVSRAIEAGLSLREPGADRGAFARDAAALCELSGHRAEADALFSLAFESLPSDARVLEGLAGAYERARDGVAALDAWDRAASAHRQDGDRAGEARALRAGADAANAQGDAAAAESRWTQAAGLVDDARAWAALALTRRALGRADAARRAEDRLLEAVQREPHLDDDVLEALVSGARHALSGDQLERARAWTAAILRARPDHPAAEELTRAIEERDLAARAADPARLFDLDPAAVPALVERAPDSVAFAVEAVEAAEDPARALEALGPALEGAVGAAVARAVVARLPEVTDGAALLELASKAGDPETRDALLDAARVRLKDAGDEAGAARALARLGVLRRDTAMLRAALTAAEREGALEIAREIVELALQVVGRGPARAALLAVRDRLARR
ncbi:MAG: hypothetical protein H6719_33940 [Sandaracinaceae bacterium]|nr:hypothetical protein [Sandaracinaceae bacterium]